MSTDNWFWGSGIVILLIVVILIALFGPQLLASIASCILIIWLIVFAVTRFTNVIIFKT